MKYKLTDETKNFDGVILLHRIECVTPFADVKAGEKGGWIESECNLSQTGNAWVRDNAKVWGDAQILDNAQVRGNAEVHGNAQVFGNAKVRGNAKVHGNAMVYENAVVTDNAKDAI